MKYLLTLLILIHALIHLIGFFKAFQLVEIKNLTSSVSKSAGVVWLFTTLLYFAVLAGYFLDKPFWPVIAIIASVISQVMIILIWKDARFGTFANILIIAVAVPAYANYRFQHSVELETTRLILGIKPQTYTVTEEACAQLPPPVQRWLKVSGAIGKGIAYCARIQQTGRLRTTPGGKWMPFSATQYVDLTNPAFIWNTTVQAAPLITMNGLDKFETGKGEMLIKLLALIPVVNEADNPKINSGSMLRYLGESVWYPTFVLSPYIFWESKDSLSAKATMRYGNTSAEGIYYFNNEGDFVAFEADRYYGGGEDARIERWRVEATDYQNFEGIRIPYKNKVIWKLKEVDFIWLELELTALETNKPELFD
jgi:hypothetical protein